MAEDERSILYKIKPGIQGDSVADAADVELDAAAFAGNLDSSVTNIQMLASHVDTSSADATSTTLDTTGFLGLLNGAATVRTALQRIDRTGLGAPVFRFAGNYSAQLSNRDEWVNAHVQGQDGQTNARRTLTLPGTTDLGTIFDSLVADSLPERISIVISYFGGPSNSSFSNLLMVTPRSGGPAFGFASALNIRRGDSATLTIERVGGTIGQWQLESRGTLPSTGGSDTLNDIELQTQTWNAAANSFLPQNPLRGYAYRVVNVPDGSNTRQGFTHIMYNGDWVVWAAETFTGWLSESDWFVMSAADRLRLTTVGNHFLNTITERDDRVDMGRASELGANDALVWLSEDPFDSAPFLNPSTDTSNQDQGYIGGRENVNAQGDFQFGSNRFGSFFRVGISPNFLASHATSDIFVVVEDNEGTEISRYSLADSFSEDGGNNTVTYFDFNPSGFGDSTFNYHFLSQIRILLTRIDRHFSIDPGTFDALPNISEIPESKLEASVRAKLNRETVLAFDDRTRLSAIETVTSDGPISATNVMFGFKFGSPASAQSSYSIHESDVGILPDFDAREVTIAVPGNVTVTSISGDAVTEVTSLLDGMRMYTATMRASGDPINDIRTIIGTVSAISDLSPTALYSIGYRALAPEVRDAIQAPHQTYELPAALEAINTGARVYTFDNTVFRSNSDHIGIQNTFALLKNLPGIPSSYPIQSSEFVNEITQSLVTLTPPSDLSDVYIPRLVGGELDNGVDTFTQGELVGPGVVDSTFTIDGQDSENPNLVLGFWFWVQTMPSNTSVMRIKERGSSTRRQILRLTPTGLQARRSNQDGGTTTSTVTHTLYGVDGRLSHTFTGTGAQEEEWYVYEPRAYTISAQLIANGNDEGTATFSYTVANLGSSQNSAVHTFNFANGHSQNVNVSYVAQTTTYGGPGHTLRVSVDQLADNVNFDIDHLVLSVTYDESVTTTTSNSYSDVPIGAGIITADRSSRIVFSFRPSASGNLELITSVQGYGQDGTPEVFDENTIDLNYPSADLDYAEVQVGGGSMVIQNVQGFWYNTDIVPTEFPRHSDLHSWLTAHDDKNDDYAWGLVSAPERDIEAVYVAENVSMPNLILEDVTKAGDRYRLQVSNGVLSAQLIE